jgi:integrase-like protein
VSRVEKQRKNEKRTPMRIKINPQWAILYAKFAELRGRSPSVLASAGGKHDSFFGLTPSAVGQQIRKTAERLTGNARSANDLRHTAAQRMVDGGASRERLAEFMGHSDLDTGNVYFTTSAAQGDIVNKALGLSPVFKAVETAFRTGTIDKAALLRLDPDHQIGTVIHGVAIAGIGACALGQSLCVKNPVLSCYDCQKFIPVNDPKPHREVVEALRPVAIEFEGASRGEMQGPAFTQLRRVLENAEEISEATDAQK